MIRTLAFALLGVIVSVQGLDTLDTVDNVEKSDRVPVLIWYPKRSTDIPALQLVDKHLFQNVMSSYLSDKPFTLVFTDESLSTEDFSAVDASGKSIYEPLHNTFNKENMLINYLATVERPVEVLKNISKNLQWPSVEISAADPLPSPKERSFAFVDLTEATGNEGRVELLSKHVETIVNAYKKSSHMNTLIVYTATRPSWFTSIPNQRQARHLMAVDETTSSTQFFNDMITLTMDAPIVETWSAGKKTDSVTFASLVFKTDTKNDTQGESIQVTGESAMGTLRFNFLKSMGYWSLKSVDTPQQQNILINDITVPVGFSYHCSTMTVRYLNTVLVLPRFQVQPRFADDNYANSHDTSVFSDAYDCVGFTSPAIWSGIIVTVIMAIILTLGLTMMLNVKTMDRFDDPKGKTITVSATD